jgi:hypothetical protein
MYAGGVGERSLVAASCQGLVAAVQVALSLVAGGNADPLAPAVEPPDASRILETPDASAGPPPPAASAEPLTSTVSAPRPRATATQRTPNHPYHRRTEDAALAAG